MNKVDYNIILKLILKLIREGLIYNFKNCSGIDLVIF